MKLFKNISSLFLAFLVLFASMSFTVSKHYCKGELKHVALYKAAEKCPHETTAEKPHCPHMAAMQADAQKDCCDDSTISIETNITDFKINPELTVNFNLPFVAVIISFFQPSFDQIDTTQVKFKDHSPPLIVQDTYVLVQSFLL